MINAKDIDIRYLRFLRSWKNLTTKELAFKLGSEKTLIDALEDGEEVDFPNSLLNEISRFYDVDEEGLLLKSNINNREPLFLRDNEDDIKDKIVDSEKVKQQRMAMNLSQTKLSELSGLTLSTIKNVETERTNLTEENAKILASYFGIDIKKLYKTKKRNTVVIAFHNNKGGSGKTSLSVNVAATLSEIYNKRVLFIDTDGQRNASEFFDHRAYHYPMNFYTSFVEGIDVRECIQPTRFKNIDVVYSSYEIGKINGGILQGLSHKEQRFSMISKSLIEQGAYDYVIVDFSPALDAFNYSLLNGCDELIVPVTPHRHAYQAIGEMIQEVSSVNQFTDRLNILGLIYTNHHATKQVSGITYDLIKTNYNDLFIPPFIRQDAAMEKASYLFQAVCEYQKDSKAQKDLNEICKNIINRIESRSK